MRRLLRLLIVIAVGLVAAAAAIFAGPVSSGALMLLWPSASRTTADHDVAEYVPLHKGHVDISTGLYIRQDDDLFVGDAVALRLRRTYLSGDRVSRQFGVGTTHEGEWYLIGDGERFQWAALILADGGRIRFDRVSPGSFLSNALFQHRATPTQFFGSELGWVGFEWALRFRRGGLALFQACGPAAGSICSLIEFRAPDGRVIHYDRDHSGKLLAMRDASDRITFEYDDRQRIVTAADTLGHDVRYSYDDAGRLTSVTTSDGVTRSYTYSDRDEMLTIDEPKWFIENTFDGSGRCIRQVTKLPHRTQPYVFEFAYTVIDGSVSETNVTENGRRTSYRFSPSHYMSAMVYDADRPAAATVTFDRDDRTNVALSMTIRCTGMGGHVVKTVPTVPGFEADVAEEVIERECQ
jgi:YD repeat-containing protein